MKFIIVCFLSFGLWSVSAKGIDSKVESVTIFLNQAQVSRSSNIAIGPETKQLVFTGLSSMLDPNSVQVKGQGDFIIMGTTFRQNYLTEENLPEAVKSLKDKIELLEGKIANVDNQQWALKSEEEMLKANQVIKGANQNLGVNELKTMAEYYRIRIQAIKDKGYELQLERRELDKALKKVKSQLEEQHAREQMVSGEVVVDINTSKTQTVHLDLSYVVSGAYWNPTYDLRATSSAQKIDLLYKANVYQNSGENWENVKLTLSTSNPSIGGWLPTVRPWYLDFFSAAPYQNKLAMPAARSEAFEPMPMEEEVLMESVADYTQMSEGLTSVNYEIALPVTVLSGGKEVTVAIREERVEAEFLYQSTPKLSERVYLVAKTKNWQRLDLLPGEMSVFYEGGFVNKSYLNPEGELEGLNISLGVDQGVQISRKPVRDLTNDQLIGNKRRISYQYEIKVKNNRSKSIDIEVFDQLPLSKNTDIEIGEIALGGAQRNEKTGLLTWSFTLEPTMEKSMKFGYEVKYPKDKRVSGL